PLRTPTSPPCSTRAPRSTPTTTPTPRPCSRPRCGCTTAATSPRSSSRSRCSPPGTAAAPDGVLHRRPPSPRDLVLGGRSSRGDAVAGPGEELLGRVDRGAELERAAGLAALGAGLGDDEGVAAGLGDRAHRLQPGSLREVVRLVPVERAAVGQVDRPGEAHAGAGDEHGVD